MSQKLSQDYVDIETDTEPVMKMRVRPIFWRRDVCNFHTMGNGTASIATSVAMFGIPVNLYYADWFMQVPPLIILFHT